MEIRQLKTFLTIIEYNNFTKAAEALGYAQSSVTSQIKSLEDEFQTQLFHRDNRSISLTADGKKLLPIAKEICRLDTKAKQELVNDDSLKGILPITTPESLCIKWFPQIFKKFNIQYPLIELLLTVYDCCDYMQRLKSNEADLAFVITNEPVSDEFNVLATWPLCMNLLVPPGHELADSAFVSYEQLSNQRLILTEEGCCYNRDMRQIVERNHIKTKDFMTSSSIQFIREMVMSGYGIGYLPSFAVEDEINQGRLISLPWEGSYSKFTTNLVCHKDKVITKKMEVFIDTVNKYFV